MTSTSPARTFLVVDDGRSPWGIDAASVTSITDERDWTGEPPRALPLAPVDEREDGEARRVLVAHRHVSSASARLPLLGCGRFSVELIPESDVLVLPPILRGWVSHVVFREGRPPLLIVDVDALAARLGAPSEDAPS